MRCVKIWLKLVCSAKIIWKIRINLICQNQIFEIRTLLITRIALIARLNFTVQFCVSMKFNYNFVLLFHYDKWINKIKNNYHKSQSINLDSPGYPTNLYLNLIDIWTIRVVPILNEQHVCMSCFYNPFWRFRTTRTNRAGSSNTLQVCNFEKRICRLFDSFVSSTIICVRQRSTRKISNHPVRQC